MTAGILGGLAALEEAQATLDLAVTEHRQDVGRRIGLDAAQVDGAIVVTQAGFGSPFVEAAKVHVAASPGA